VTNIHPIHPPHLSDKHPNQKDERSVIGRLVRVHIWIALAISIFATIADYYGLLPEAPDKAFSDFVAARFSTVISKQRSDVQLVLVDEKTLSGSQYLVPTDRALLASILKSIDKCAPRVIAVDFIFDRPTEPEKDRALLGSGPINWVADQSAG
jgi:CHASE2 domain-containing sensor protein